MDGGNRVEEMKVGLVGKWEPWVRCRVAGAREKWEWPLTFPRRKLFKATGKKVWSAGAGLGRVCVFWLSVAIHEGHIMTFTFSVKALTCLNLLGVCSAGFAK